LKTADSRTGEISLQAKPPTDGAAQLLAEVRLLGTLCNREGTIQQRAELVHALDRYVFLEPEHQVVFESIRSLLRRDTISAARLALHLNNRGFPDVDLEKYFAAALTNIEDALRLARQVCSSENGCGAQEHSDSRRKVKRDA
jgi:hypothetical protein